MLEDKVKEAKKVVDQEGSCKFCGQIALMKAPAGWDQEALNELATENCKCGDAQVYTRRKKRLEKAEEIIDRTFLKPKMMITEAAVKALKRAAACMISAEFDSIQIKCGEVTATIQKDAEGNITITGSRKEKDGGKV